MRACLLLGESSPITFTLAGSNIQDGVDQKPAGVRKPRLVRRVGEIIFTSERAIVRSALQLVKGASRTTNSSANGDLILFCTPLYIVDSDSQNRCRRKGIKRRINSVYIRNCFFRKEPLKMIHQNNTSVYKRGNICRYF